MFKFSKFLGLQKSFVVLQFWADPGSCSPSACIMISSTVTINAINRVSGGKKLFLASLQQTCYEYLYLNINKSKLAFLLQKSSGDFWVIFIHTQVLCSLFLLGRFTILMRDKPWERICVIRITLNFSWTLIDWLKCRNMCIYIFTGIYILLARGW